MKWHTKIVLVLLVSILMFLLGLIVIDAVREYHWCRSMNEVRGMSTRWSWNKLDCKIYSDPLDLIDPNEWLQSGDV